MQYVCFHLIVKGYKYTVPPTEHRDNLLVIVKIWNERKFSFRSFFSKKNICTLMYLQQRKRLWSNFFSYICFTVFNHYDKNKAGDIVSFGLHYAQKKCLSIFTALPLGILIETIISWNFFFIPINSQSKRCEVSRA